MIDIIGKNITYYLCNYLSKRNIDNLSLSCKKCYNNTLQYKLNNFFFRMMAQTQSFRKIIMENNFNQSGIHKLCVGSVCHWVQANSLYRNRFVPMIYSKQYCSFTCFAVAWFELFLGHMCRIA